MQIPQTEITLRDGDTELVRVVLPPGEYVIGRDLEAEIRADTPLLSHRHALLTVNYDHLLIEDLGSSNGTSVNGQPVTDATRLWPNQKVQFGAVTLEFHRVKSAPAPDVSLAPASAALREVLPEEFLHGKKYEIGGVVAQGGMGAILDAREATIERTVAMKVMLDGSSPDDLVRFVAEAKVTGQLEHPNIVPVHELGIDENGQPFYTMKFVRGITLRKVLDLMAAGTKETIRKYPLGTLLTIFQKVCDAVAFAHSRGVIHRDLKPDNIMLGDFGEVLVMDWGLAKVGGSGESPAPPGTIGATLRHSRPLGTATMTGSIMGTPQYMAPEQARGEVETLDARADIYSLGAILFHILALRPSVSGDNVYAIVDKVARGEIEWWNARSEHVGRWNARSERVAAAGGQSGGLPPGPEAKRARSARSTVPNSLAAVVRKAMAFDKAERYPGVADLQADLTAYQNGFATGAERAGLVKQLALLIKRNKGIFATAAAAWLIITAIAVWFVLSIRASERTANENAAIAARNAEQARAAEKLADQRAENTRRALAKSQIAVAESAYRSGNGPEITAALKDVPPDLRDADWSYLSTKADMSLGVVLKEIDIVSVSPNPKEPGVFAVSDITTGKIIVLRARTGEKLLEFRPDFSPIHNPTSKSWQVAFSPDGEKLVVGQMSETSGGTLVCDAHDGKKLLEWDTPRVERLAFSPDGKTILEELFKTSPPVQRTVALSDTATGKQLWTHWNDEAVGSLSRATFTSDGRWIICVRAGLLGKMNTISVLGSGDGSIQHEWNGNPSFPAIYSQAQSFKGGHFAVGSAEGEVLGIERGEGQVIYRSRVQTRAIDNLAITPDDNRVITVAAFEDGRQHIQVWNHRTGRPLESLLGGNGNATAIAMHPLSGELFIAGKESRLWNFASPPEIWAGRNAGRAASFWRTDDTLFASNTGNHFAQLWNIRDNKLLWDAAPQGQHERVSLSADGRFAALIGHPVQVLAWADGKAKLVSEALTASSFNRTTFRLSPDGSRAILTSPGEGKCAVYDVLKGNKLCDLAVPTKGWSIVNDANWVSDSQIVVLSTVNASRGTPGFQERISLLDATTGQEIRFAANPTALKVLAVSPDGRSFAEAGTDRNVRIRDATTLEVRREFRVHDAAVTALAWHPKNPILATGSADFTVKLWDIETGRSLEEIHGLLNEPSALGFSPSGTRLACAVLSDAAHVWEPVCLNGDKPHEEVKGK